MDEQLELAEQYALDAQAYSSAAANSATNAAGSASSAQANALALSTGVNNASGSAVTASTAAATATSKANEASTAAATATSKANEAATSASTAASLLNNSVRHDITQTLSAANQLRARGNIGLGTRSMGNDIVGAGRPDISATMDADTLARVTAATSGMTFYSTDGPQGAWVWRKRGSTWVCVEGDTGAVDASALLVGGEFELASISGYFTVRREPTRIFYAGRLQLRADSSKVGWLRTTGQILNPVPFPMGWYNGQSTYGVYVTVGAATIYGTPLKIGAYSNPDKLFVYGTGNWAASDPVEFTAQTSIPANLAWPTTLTI